jgi:excisionase family DNA binding protein
MQTNQKFYTLDEIEQTLGLSRWQLLRLLKDGKLRGVKIGRQTWRIPEDCFQRFLDERAAGL